MPFNQPHLNHTDESILLSLARHGKQSRADLARRLGVMRSTIGARVGGLFEAGLVQASKDDPTKDRPPNVGRPGAAIELRPEFCQFVGVEFRIGFIRTFLSDFQCNVQKVLEVQMTEHEQSPHRVVSTIADMVNEITRGFDRVAGMSISVPGVTRRDGVVVRLPLDGWHNVPFIEMLRRKLNSKWKIQIDNDANVFAKGELLSDPDRDVTSAIFIWMDTGVGTGIVLNGRLHRGATGRAGEVGDMFVRDAGGPPARLDAVAGFQGVARRCHDLDLEVSTVTDLLKVLENDDCRSRDILGVWKDGLTDGLAALTCIFDPDELVFSGNMAKVLTKTEDEVKTALSSKLLPGSLMPKLIIREDADTRIAEACLLTLRESVLADQSSSDLEPSN